jgi:hypothetical protein
MRPLLIFLILLTVGCASKAPERSIASAIRAARPNIYDHTRSLAHIFPAVAADNGIWYYFYVETKNTYGRFYNIDPSEIEIKTHKGKKVAFKYEQILAGRYYLTLEKTVDVSSAELDIFVRGKALKEQFKLNMRQPDKANSTIKLVKISDNRLVFRLRLADKKNQPVEMPDKPEIILEGMANVEDVTHVSEGTWEFTVIYPEQNQIMYFSVRAMGVYLSNIYRYQHVEK